MTLEEYLRFYQDLEDKKKQLGLEFVKDYFNNSIGDTIAINLHGKSRKAVITDIDINNYRIYVWAKYYYADKKTLSKRNIAVFIWNFTSEDKYSIIL